MSDQKLTIGNTPDAGALTGSERIWVWQNGALLSTQLSNFTNVIEQIVVRHSPHTITVDEQCVLVYLNVPSSAVINLPPASTYGSRPLYIKDASGIAYTYNITVNTDGADVFEDGSTSFTFYDNFEGHEFIPAYLGTTWTWIVRS